ncbi:MAG: hypothetical protein C0591_13125 [Marinilabiliales bacterium]|nr:MAG: hypothetical protein C0591_13125 [Marinilabiliales bacterium]
MKNLLLLLAFTFFLCASAKAQEYADFEITGTNQGTGSFTNAVLPNFTWTATGTINGSVQLLDDEVFDDGNAFENTFGQADNAENLRTQIYPNGPGSIGNPILSKSKLTINFDQTAPAEGWGFCVVDIDVENCLISAIDENDNEVDIEDIDNWLIELFDTDVITDGINIPKWDPTHAALLGYNTPEDYLVYNNLVIGGLDESEAAAAFFMPNIPLKSLIIDYENLQDGSFVSFHFYIASLSPTGIQENDNMQLRLHPNPATSIVTLQSSFFNQQSSFVGIYDLNGRQFLEKHFISGTETIELDISGLHSGLYFCRISSNKYSITKKLFIK